MSPVTSLHELTQYPQPTASRITRVPVPNAAPIKRVPVPSAATIIQPPVPDASHDTVAPRVDAEPDLHVGLESAPTQRSIQSPLGRAYRATRRSMQKHWVLSMIAEFAAGGAGSALLVRGVASPSYYDDNDNFVSGKKPVEIGFGSVLLIATAVGVFISCISRNRTAGSYRNGNIDPIYENGLFMMGAQNNANVQANYQYNQVQAQNNSNWANSN
ncbi:MAG: hypothetical protein EOO38_18825 [Cytophagaceae bacterium]|nr:MAG: hypothetical protein EOO38_18825 [Cytophagaceae bacterium]